MAATWSNLLPNAESSNCTGSRARVLALSRLSCVTLGKLVNLSSVSSSLN